MVEFQRKLRSRGALNSFKLGENRYLVIDPAAAPALRVMADMQRAPVSERREFIRNPRQRIAAAIEKELSSKAEFQSLDPASKEEMLESLATPLFVETEEYAAFSDRVTGVEVYKGNPLADIIPSGLVWYTETFPEGLKAAIAEMNVEALSQLENSVQQAMAQGKEDVDVGAFQLPATESTLELLKYAQDQKTSADAPDERAEDDTTRRGPVVLQTKENFEELEWHAKLTPRVSRLATTVPSQLRTALKDHQVKSLEWQIAAWRAGLPGVLNADEQGLGKTLQTISFLVWLNEGMKEEGPKLPILVVAPTSLLRNWEEEVERHVAKPGLGYLVRLYGGATSARKLRGRGSRDTERGECTIDLSDITRSVQQGNGHLTWVLTTYTTLTNYQLSLARIPFAALVFDEIQNIKNPGTLAAKAGKAMKADFRIGLTGTPIENSTAELWAVMDQLAPGALGTLKEFRSAYKEPQEGNMAELYARVFTSQNGLPPLAIRRLKSEVARDLPEKARLLHPRLMPPVQAKRYDEARIKLAQGGMGAALKMLHHIRGVSVHPAVDDPAGDHEYISASARLSAVFDILRRVKRQGERALVFIEHRKMQYRFIELAKAELDLQAIDLINGETLIPKRQQIINRFQSAQHGDECFDILVLGPKAAGTGLTLTAATHVIHLSRWWNPAVEEQCNDRVHRIGQTRPVTVHIPLAVHPELREMSFDLLLQTLMQRKRRLASAALWPMGEAGDEADYLQEQLQQGSRVSGGDAIQSAMMALFERDKSAPLARHPDGSWLIN
ncbi:helicase-like protein [Camelimonas lactis]|uniref:Helicase-like protein n=1 Tax=Camelimonas lactis TaxID=659006 RepID=A0A4R2GU92_9HYPH|nr:helicase-like protein [Camelimonas lactis]